MEDADGLQVLEAAIRISKALGHARLMRAAAERARRSLEAILVADEVLTELAEVDVGVSEGEEVDSLLWLGCRRARDYRKRVSTVRERGGGQLNLRHERREMDGNGRADATGAGLRTHLIGVVAATATTTAAAGRGAAAEEATATLVAKIAPMMRAKRKATTMAMKEAIVSVMLMMSLLEA